MKRMSAKAFLDTNILVYAHTDVDIIKQSLAQNLIRESRSFISTQVLQELASTLFRKFHQPWKNIEMVLMNAADNSVLDTNTNTTIKSACQVAQDYKISFYDSLILSSALECECSILYTEDLTDGQIIKNLKIINPFVDSPK